MTAADWTAVRALLTLLLSTVTHFTAAALLYVAAALRQRPTGQRRACYMALGALVRAVRGC